MLCSSCRHEVKPVVAIDIDGTLGEHHAHFHEFAERYVDQELGESSEVRDGLGRFISRVLRPYPYDVEFSDWLQMPKTLYRETKLAYRQGGMKRLMPVHDGASELVDNLRSIGAEVWLCTTRPYLRLDNIDPDTREWLRRNRIEYDGLIYGEDKYQRLADIVGDDRVVGVLDDLPEMFDAAEALELCPVQKVNGHRGDALRSPGVDTLWGAGRLLAERVRDWYKETR